MEISIDFSVEELVVLSRQLNMAPPATLGELSSISEEAVEVARRALVARRVVSAAPGAAGEPLRTAGETEESKARDALYDMVYVMCAPALKVEVTRRASVTEDVWFILALPEAAIEQAQVCEGVFRCTPFRTEEVPGRLKMRAQLTDRVAPLATGASLSGYLLRRLVSCLNEVDEADREKARDACRGSGDTDAANKVVELLLDASAWLNVSVENRETREAGGTIVEAREVAWVDGGAGGLWRVPSEIELDQYDPSHAFDVSPTTQSDLEVDLRSMFSTTQTAPLEAQPESQA